MKKAYFTYTDERFKSSIRGSVTLKDDGKISVSLFDTQHGTCAAERYSAKKLGLQIAESDFNHPAVTGFEQDDVVLIKLLKENTEDLRIEYIETCKKFETEEFARKTSWLEKVDAKGNLWPELFGILFEETTNYMQKKILVLVQTKENKERYYSARKAIDGCRSYLSTGLVENVAKAAKYADMHYAASISKLASRIETKKFDISKLTIETARVGLNLEMVLNDGAITIKAWTIVASGPIQRPHYRYLVK